MVGFFSETLLAAVETTPELEAIFAEGRMLQRWLDFEATLASAQADVGLIPRAAAEHIRSHARLEEIDRAALSAELQRANHVLVPLLRQLAARCAPWGGYVHWGATTQDVVDCGLVLQLREAWPVLERDLVAVARALRALAARHRDTVMAGRTYSQQAMPTTFGLKAAIWLAECRRHRARLRALGERVLVGQLGGAVGTMAGFGPRALEIQALTLAALGLRAPPLPWHTARDGLAELVTWAALCGATLGKIAAELIALARTEVGEVAEPAAEGSVGSSTMPHKRNPFWCHKLVAAATLLRELPASMLAAMAHLHERDGGAWAVEHATVPRAVCLVGAALQIAAHVLANLIVRPDRMRQNLDRAGGAATSEAVMLELGRTLGRDQAHDLVHEIAARALAEDRPLAAVLREDARVRARIDAQRLEELLDPTAYTGQAGTLVDRILAEVDADGSAPGDRGGRPPDQPVP